MADFVQRANTRSATRTLAKNPLADVATYGHPYQDHEKNLACF